MAFFQARSQSCALAPIVWMNRAFCLDFIHVSGRRSHVLTLLYAALAAGLYAWLYRSGVDDDIGWAAYQEISYAFVLWVNVIVGCVSVILGLAHAQDSRQFVRRCELIDDTLESFGVKKDYSSCLRNVVVTIPAWIIIMVSLYAMDAYWMIYDLGFVHGVRLCALVHVPFSVNSMVITTFCTFTRVLKDKVCKLNVAMREMSRSARPISGRKIHVAMDYVNRKRFVQHFLQTSRLVHLEIVRIGTVVNDSFCYQLLLELLVEFTLIIGILYNLYFELLQLASTGEMILGNRTIAAFSFWLLINSGKIVAVNNLCHAIHHEAKLTGECLRELEGSYSDDNLRDEINQFSLQLILRPLCFSAGGFVYLDNRLTKMFFGTIMTYMAILVQMSSTPAAIRSLTQVVTD